MCKACSIIHYSLFIINYSLLMSDTSKIYLQTIISQVHMWGKFCFNLIVKPHAMSHVNQVGNLRINFSYYGESLSSGLMRLMIFFS